MKKRMGMALFAMAVATSQIPAIPTLPVMAATGLSQMQTEAETLGGGRN